MSENLSGKVAIVTGATSGIGRATAVDMAKRGADLYIVARNAEKGEALVNQIRAESGNEKVSLLLADLGKQADIRSAAQQFLDTGKPLHLLINNAGVTNSSRNVTSDGIEETLAVNHLGYFLFTELLRPKLVETGDGRVVSVASEGYKFVKGINFDDMQFTQGYKTFRVYGHSKLCNILWTRELARKLEGTGVIANCVHPGAVSTGLGTQNGFIGKLAQWLMKPFFKTPEQGAATTIYCATSPEVASITGEYFADCKIKSTKPWAKNDEEAARLWEVSEKMVGLA